MAFAYQTAGFAYQGAGVFAYQGGGDAPIVRTVDPGDKPPYRKSPHRGFSIEEWRKERGALDESLTQTLERVWGQLAGDPDARDDAEEIVRPFVLRAKPGTLADAAAGAVVDWAALARSVEAVWQIAQAQALREALRQKKVVEADDEVITLLLLS